MAPHWRPRAHRPPPHRGLASAAPTHLEIEVHDALGVQEHQAARHVERHLGQDGAQHEQRQPRALLLLLTASPHGMHPASPRHTHLAPTLPPGHAPARDVVMQVAALQILSHLLWHSRRSGRGRVTAAGAAGAAIARQAQQAQRTSIVSSGPRYAPCSR